MKDKEIQKLAQEILKCENELRLGKNKKSNEAKIEKIMCSLTIREMLELDNYIMSKEPQLEN